MKSKGVHPEVAGLKGGRKQHWLRVNRKLVENHYSMHGPEATCEYFNMSLDTLGRFFERKDDEIRRLNQLSENDRYVLRMAMDRVRALEHENNERFDEVEKRLDVIDEFHAEALPVIEVVRNLVLLTKDRIQSKVNLPTLPEHPIELNNFGGKSNTPHRKPRP